MNKDTVIVRGGGDVASGAIQKLHRSGFKVLILEIENPTSIRRKVSFSEAIYDQNIEIENIKASHVDSLDAVHECWNNEKIPVVVDPDGIYIGLLKPEIVVDGILAKKNLGTNMGMAPITIALGPGFEAGKDVNAVIETNRGHNLGRLIFKGKAADDTGVPGVIAGYSKERVIYSPYSGIINNIKDIGDTVKSGETIAHIGCFRVKANISGVLRGIIRDRTTVKKGLKIADVDPRISEKKNCFTISDKARNIGGGVLEAIMYIRRI
ncbi:EF2563 family selenium-dependent molybdenum hydroxylase system protein [Clostridium tyrobutyricum]|jgi:xanthine dehydrogenase accessory factor|nr:selenium-dependent molybdenum cofactor biosynthesis protein YqeB [Clostridium tyrobutyricum]ANP70864.1 molybdenum hydroxylase [Clostridium tyrobutyricum]MBR9648671.1 EF2563 family selenium-dependent molybdenum hydroxylase system protein [Clostridium tyrobutyricum]MBV4415590.1 EF2563 family selenium-dependent molybdenum hydroxylase system protein [Clostridium tyrobutyricum]MBV4427332.1 EF2563 family selenium-dependent molybdenum hydroxylase system protein [Clostridium tyrobutyricum]MBV443015